MEQKETRKLKVIEQPTGYNGSAPTIILKGKWLGQYFNLNDRVEVVCEKDKLTITRIEEEPIPYVDKDICPKCKNKLKKKTKFCPDCGCKLD